MISRTTWRLLAAVLLLGAYLWFVERDSMTTGERQNRDTRILRLDPERITYLAVESEDFYAECEHRRAGWFLTTPVHARADSVRLEQIVSALEDLPRLETITPAQRQARGVSLEAYELTSPRARITVESAGRREELLLGCDAPSGDGLYVKTAAGEDVIATTTNLLAVLPQAVDELRERHVLHRDALQASRLEIHRPGGFVQLARRNGAWMIQQPVTAQADGEKINGILAALSSLTVEDFVADSRADPVAYQLTVNDAVAQVALWWEGDEIGLRIFFGKAAEEGSNKIFARRGDVDSIYTVKRQILDTLSAKAGELRAKAIFAVGADDVYALAVQQGAVRTMMERSSLTSNWQIVEPVQCPADNALVGRVLAQILGLQAQSFLEGVSTNLAEFGLQVPLQILDLGGARISTTGAAVRVGDAAARNWSVRLRVGHAREGGTNTYGMLESDNSVFEMPAEGLRWKTTSGLTQMLLPAESAGYRDRVVLRLNPANVRRIARAAAGGQAERSVERGADGKWRVPPPAQGEVQSAIVEEMLNGVTNLVAVRMVDDRPGQEAGYGLSQTQATFRLTFGLAGDGAIQKTLILGLPADAEGEYAMLQGQDLIFVLPREIADRLRRDFVR